MKCLMHRANGISIDHIRYFLNTLFKSFLLSYKSKKVIFVLSIVMGFLHSFSYALFTLVLEGFFDSIKVAQDRWKERILFWLFVLTIVILLREFFNAAHNLCGTLMRDYSKCYNLFLIHERTAQLSAYQMEKKETLDYIDKAKRGAEVCFTFIDNFLDFFDFYLPYFIFMGIYLFRINWRMPFLIVIIFLPFLINAFLKNKIFSNLEITQVQYIRHKDILKKSMTDFVFVKEINLYDALDFLKKKFKIVQKEYHKRNEISEMKSTICEIAMKLVTLLGYCGVLGMLTWELLNGSITIGEFAAIFSSLGIMFTMMEYTIYRDFGSSVKKMYVVDSFIKFLIAEKRNHTSIERIQSLELKNVFFQYQNGKDILKDISLSVNKNEMIAIVGENGAGKTTLSKVLMGLYPIEKGAYLINGKPIECNKYNQNFLNQISAIFQNFVHYKMNAKDNIKMSNLEKHDIEELYEIADKLGISNIMLDDESILSKEFSGKELSGGQWQRLAIARAVYRECNLLFMDEPTSAIDPLEEMRLYEIMKKIGEGKISFIVTHRMGCAQLADKIIVLDHGEIVGFGKHQELLDSNEIYRRLYQEQAKWYK